MISGLPVHDDDEDDQTVMGDVSVKVKVAVVLFFFSELPLLLILRRPGMTV
jgi:hypothetical protein